MATLLTDEEKEALKGLSHLQRCLYVFGIRWYMDSSTRITGIKRGISYQSLAEEMHVNPVSGIQDSGTPSRWAMIRAVNSLVDAGLLLNKSVGKRLILECILAPQKQSVQNKAAPRPHQEPAPQAAPEEFKEKQGNSMVYKENDSQAAPQAAHAKMAQAARPPLSNIYINKIESNAHEILKSYPQGSLRQLFFDLLKDRSYGLDSMIDPHTGAMIGVWENKGVTHDDMKSGMDYCDLKEGGSPRFPSKYQYWVLNAMRARLRAEEEISKPEVGQRPQQRSRPKKDEFQELKEKWMSNLAGTEFDDGTFGDLSAYAKAKQSG